MAVYVINLLLSCLICSGIKMKRDKQRALGLKPSAEFGYILLFVLWVCLYTFRYKVGSDSWTFNENLEYFMTRNVSFSEYVSEVRDTLYAVVYYVFIQVLGFKRVWFYMVMGILTYFPIIQVLKERDENLVFSVFLYCTTLSCYSGYNGTRQAIATGFIMLAYYKYFLKRDYVKYAIIMLIAFGFHSATLFALPFHLLSKKRIDSIVVVGSSVALLISVIFLQPMWGVIIDFLDFIGQDKMARDYAIYVAKGANILRLFVVLVPFILVLLNNKKLSKSGNGIEALIVLSLFGNIFSVFMMRNACFARIVGIVDISGIILLPKLPSSFDGRVKNIMIFSMIALYFAYMIIMLKGGESHLYPYQFLPSLDSTW